MAKSKFRSITDLKGYQDFSKTPGGSLCDPSQYEPIESLVKRLTRGEIFVTSNAEYDEDPSFDVVPPQRQDGFDLSDIPRYAEQAERASEALKKLKATPPSEKVEKPKEEAPKPSPEAVKQ